MFECVNEKRQVVAVVVVVVVASCCHLSSSSSSFGAAYNLKGEKVYIEACELRILKRKGTFVCSRISFCALLLSSPLLWPQEIKICLYTKRWRRQWRRWRRRRRRRLFSQQTQLNTMCQGRATTTSHRRIFLTIFFVKLLPRSLVRCLKKKRDSYRSSHMKGTFNLLTDFRSCLFTLLLLLLLSSFSFLSKEKETSFFSIINMQRSALPSLTKVFATANKCNFYVTP